MKQLHTLVGAALLAAASWAGAAGVETLAPGVAWLPGRFVSGEQPDGNSVIFEAPEGMVIVDTGRHPAHADALLDHLRERGRPLAVIVNSHWHLDHIGGNAALRSAFPGVGVVASNAIEAARGGFLARYRKQLDAEIAKLPAGSAARAGLQRELAIIANREAPTPTIVVAASGSRTLAGKAFLVGLEADAVTAGDVWLFDPASKVLASGDLITLPAPLFDTACPKHWQGAFERLAAQPFAWLVPGHGKPMRRAQFDTYRRAYAGLLQCWSAGSPKAECSAGWLRDAAELIPPADIALARGLLDYYLSQPPAGEAQCVTARAASSPPP